MTSVATDNAISRWLANIPEGCPSPELYGPMRLMGGWVAVTDRSLIIAEKIDLETMPDVRPFPADKDSPFDWLQPGEDDEPLGTGSIGSLRKRAGEPIWPVRKDGKWIYGEPHRYVIGGADFDLARIALAAAVLPDDCRVTFYVTEHFKVMHRLLGVTGDIRFVLGSMKPVQQPVAVAE